MEHELPQPGETTVDLLAPVPPRWWCRWGIHFWRVGGRDSTGHRYFVCRTCKVFGA